MVPSAHSGGIGTLPVVGRSCDHWILSDYQIIKYCWIIRLSNIIRLSDHEISLDYQTLSAQSGKIGTGGTLEATFAVTLGGNLPQLE